MDWRAPTVVDSRRVLAAAAVSVLAVAVGLGAYVTSRAYDLEDPYRGLQQLDLLYLDQPAPLVNDLGLSGDRPALVVVCEACDPPPVDAQVVVSNDPDVAAAYALLTDAGRVGPGYALVDAGGRLRYRTFDPALGEHGKEIRILLEGLP